jgi:sugar lactone lactonase YvrE
MSSKHLGFAIAAFALAAGCAPEAEPPAASNGQAAPAAATPPPTPTPTAAADAGASSSGMPAVIVAERGGFIPEGVEYDAANSRLLTGSLADGTIYTWDDEGSLTAVVQDPELVSSVGIEVDEPRDRLLVANSDSAVFQGGTQGHAKLGVYRLSTGERLAMVDLGGLVDGDGAFFANDVAVADSGEIYVTDTQRNVVSRVDNEYEASVLHAFEPMEGLQLNGIEYHTDRYLLVISLGNGNLYKVPVDDPDATSQVTLPEPVAGGDGAVWTADGRLAIVSNSSGRVVALASDDAWASARVVGTATYEGQATTAAAVGDDVYVVKPHFADQDPPSIERVTIR